MTVNKTDADTIGAVSQMQEGPLVSGPSAQKDSLLSLGDLSADGQATAPVGIISQRTQSDISTQDSLSQSNSGQVVDTHPWSDIALHLTHSRLTKYMARAQGDSKVAIALYEWDCRLAASLLFPLRQFEIFLRNSICKALSDKYGHNWHAVAKFYGCTSSVTQNVSDTKDVLHKVKFGASYTVDDFVANTTFNFWRELCKPEYIIHFWSKRLKLSFNNIPYRDDKPEGLKELHNKVDLILKLRNRVAHHEPIIGKFDEKIGEKTKERFDDIICVLGWIDQDLLKWVQSCCTFDEILNKCPIPRN